MAPFLDEVSDPTAPTSTKSLTINPEMSSILELIAVVERGRDRVPMRLHVDSIPPRGKFMKSATVVTVGALLMLAGCGDDDSPTRSDEGGPSVIWTFPRHGQVGLGAFSSGSGAVGIASNVIQIRFDRIMNIATLEDAIVLRSSQGPDSLSVEWNLTVIGGDLIFIQPDRPFETAARQPCSRSSRHGPSHPSLRAGLVTDRNDTDPRHGRQRECPWRSRGTRHRRKAQL